MLVLKKLKWQYLAWKIKKRRKPMISQHNSLSTEVISARSNIKIVSTNMGWGTSTEYLEWGNHNTKKETRQNATIIEVLNFEYKVFFEVLLNRIVPYAEDSLSDRSKLKFNFYIFFIVFSIKIDSWISLFIWTSQLSRQLKTSIWKTSINIVCWQKILNVLYFISSAFN